MNSDHYLVETLNFRTLTRAMERETLCVADIRGPWNTMGCRLPETSARGPPCGGQDREEISGRDAVWARQARDGDRRSPLRG
jgi:hypothetical protein